MFACAYAPSLPGNADAFAALVPVIETPRLRLRALRVTDYAAYLDIVTNDRWHDEPMTEADAWYDFANLSAAWMLHGHGGWAVETDGQLVGFVLIGFEPGDAQPELGWALCAAAEGNGYATEAAQAALAWAQDEGLILVSYIAPTNAKSAAVAARVGATLTGTLEGSDVWTYPNPEVRK